MALHNSPVNATFLSDNLMSEYINMNVTSLPPVNSEDEEEFDDDIVSQSGSESVSVQGSELDLDSMDDVDSLVLNIRDKLRMANNVPLEYRTSHSAGDYCWTESPSAASTPNSIHSTASNTDDGDLLILPQHQRSSAAALPSTSGSSGGGSNNKGGRKRRNSASRSSWRHHSHSNNPTQSYYKQFHHHQSGSISKSKYQNNHWWSSRPFSDLSKQSRSKDAYHLLQELLSSGTLIKEAVRRLNRKCLSSSSNNIGNNSSSNNSSGGNYNNNITSVATTVSSNPCYGSSSGNTTSNNNSIPIMMDSINNIGTSSGSGGSNNLPSFTHYNYN